MMLPVSASHFSIDCSVSDAIYKRKPNYSTRKTLYANCLKNILLTNRILCTNICLVKLF